MKLSWNINKTPAAGAAGGHVFQKGLNWHKIANFHSCEGVIRLKNLFVSAMWKSICSAVCNCFLKKWKWWTIQRVLRTTGEGAFYGKQTNYPLHKRGALHLGESKCVISNILTNNTYFCGTHQSWVPPFQL